VPTNADIDNSNIVSSASKKRQQLQIPVQELKKDDYSHKGENCHSKNTDEQFNELEKELNNEHLKPDPKANKRRNKKVTENN
jgi:hypothetical protein